MLVRKFVATLAATLACLCFGSIAAQASEPVSGSGSSQVTLVPVAAETADGNTFITYTYVETFTGFLAGVRVGKGSLVIHPDGTLNAHASGTFTGTIAGSAPGTAILKVEVSGTFSAAVAQVLVSDGTGGLAGVQGNLVDHGSATGPTSFAGTYSGQVMFGIA